MHPLIIMAVATFIYPNGKAADVAAGPFPSLYECAEMINSNRHIPLENGGILYISKAACEISEDIEHEYKYDENGNDISSTNQSN